MKIAKRLLTVAALALSSAAVAGHSELQVPPSDTFLLGGDQGATMNVSGKNIGRTFVVVLSRKDGVETTIATVAPNVVFNHDYAVGETALIRNQSATEIARLSVDFTGSPSSLSMGYALPQK